MKKYLRKNTGLDCYDPETRVFPKIACKVGKRQGLDERDVLLMLKWKLGRIRDDNKKTISKRRMKKINNAVDIARQQGEEIKALKILDEVHGINLSTATAILTICYPNKFTIFDFRALETLDLKPDKTENWTADNYFKEYLPCVRKRSKRWRCSLRNADRALWGLSVDKRIKKVIKKAGY
jgi:hypothetical protein